MLKGRWKIYILLSGFVAILSFVGCAGRELEIEPLLTTENPTEQITRLAQQINKAKDERLDVLAPTFFAEAESSLATATALRNRGGDISSILEAVAQGSAQIRKGKELAKVANLALPRAIKAREDARVVGATAFKKDYGRAEEGFLKLTRAIEKDNLQWAERNEAEAVKAFRSLELRAITRNALGSVKAMIQEAKSDRAMKIAPRTLAVAEKKLKDAEDFISKSRYEKEQILRKSQEAQFYAKRLQQIMRESVKFGDMKGEDVALWVEDMLFDLGGEVSASDTRDESLSSQARHLQASVASLKAENQKAIEALRGEQEKLAHQIVTQQVELTAKARAQEEEFLTRARAQEAELKGLKQQLASIEGRSEAELVERRRLQEEIKFNELFMDVQKYFESDEAEVYKQGDKLLVRLKGIKFPVGQYVIMPGNFNLLSKVQRAVRTFNKPIVVVEGHTDSTGSDATNQTLSQLRAESVREYLVANGVVGGDKIQAVGFGSKKPLASNETPEGRELNRRIDLIIQPEARKRSL
jgi:OmpA-OmpF porin, OOP family